MDGIQTWGDVACIETRTTALYWKRKKLKFPNIRVDCVRGKICVVVEGSIRLERHLNKYAKTLWECRSVLAMEPTTKVAWQLDTTSLWNETLPTYIGYAWHGNAIHNQTWALMPLSRPGHVFCTFQKHVPRIIQPTRFNYKYLLLRDTLPYLKRLPLSL